MQQFFIESLKELKLSKEQERQCTKVLRMRAGDEIRLVDGSGSGVIAELTNMNPLELIEIDTITFETQKTHITLIASLIRPERLEWMIQKACEVGANRIVLMQADHGVVRDFGDRIQRKLERWNLIAKEASEQAYLSTPVTIEGVITKEDLENYRSDLNVFADLGPGDHIMNAKLPHHESMTIVIGPEGGFSESEVKYFNSKEFAQISLGKSVLRAETASIIACALVRASEAIA